MRLDNLEKEALRFALEGFEGEAYLFGSRLNDGKRGGDIDILLMPKRRVNSARLSIKLQARFFSRCEERIDIVIYNDNPFCREILKNAKRLDISRI